MALGWLTSLPVEWRKSRRASGAARGPLAISAKGGPTGWETTWHGEQTLFASSSPARASDASSATPFAQRPTVAAMANAASIRRARLPEDRALVIKPPSHRQAVLQLTF